MTTPTTSTGAGRFVGLDPWLPWPLSAWDWWTKPVRAERLASMRIGLAVLLLIDLFWNYRPFLLDFFTAGSPGNPEIFAYYGEAPKLWWSLFRGFNDPMLSFIAFVVCGFFSVYLGLDLWARLTGNQVAADPQRPVWPIALWWTAGVVVVLGVWARDLSLFRKAGADWKPTALTWLAPLLLFGLSWWFWVLESIRIYRRPADTGARWWLVYLLAWIVFFALFAVGIAQHFFWIDEPGDPPTYHEWHAEWWQALLLSWQSSPRLIEASFWVWVGGVVFLLFGCWTRAAAILVWVLSTSFANINPHIDNAGDTVRGIALFYLMLCPCGAAWSVDAWRERRRGAIGPAFVSPWPIGLLVVQMAFIYCMNGLYKVVSSDWRDGESLYLVLSDLELTRFSHAQLFLPHFVTRIMTWTVLIWEITFPLFLFHRWTRLVAFALGFSFHLGIFISMELGGFAPYMWTMYLPLLPWERWIGRGQT